MNPVDPAILRWVVEHRPTVAGPLARGISAVGSGPFLFGAVALGSGAIWRRTRRPDATCAPFVGYVAAELVANGMKPLIDRERPPASWHWARETSHSFPSGHSTISSAGLLTVALVLAATTPSPRRHLPVLLAAAGTGAVGLSRVTLAVHWPSDVLGGWAIGGGIAAVTSGVVRRRLTRPSRPSRDPGGLVGPGDGA